MKRTLLAALLLVGLMGANTALAAPYEWVWTLNDSTSTPYTYPMQGAFGVEEPRVLVYDPSTHQPGLLQLNGGLQVESGKLVIDNIPQIEIQDLVSNLATLTSGLAGKANISHTHTASDITDFNSAVDARIPASMAMTFATSTRSLNTAFKISSTSPSFVSYTVDIAATLSLTGGDTGTVTLQYADDSGFTTNVKAVQSSVNGNAGALTIGLNLTQTATASLTGMIPKNKWVRITTANTAGTPTFTYRTQQEVLLPLS